MYRIYEKVPKSQENEYGLKLLESTENPFKDNPCLVSMIAIAMWEKNINGALNCGMEALRLKTSHNENAGIDLEEFEGRILSIAYGEPSENVGPQGKQIMGIAPKEKLDAEFTEKYLFPLIEENGGKIDVLQAMKNMRNVNIITYCNATTGALNFEECLKNRMNKLGYSEQEISEILSQMCIVGYATDVIKRAEFSEGKKIEATCISFGDVNDGDVCASQALKDAGKKMGTFCFEQGYYFCDGTGEHSVDEYIQNNTSLSTGISTVITKALSNAIENNKSNEFKPITKEEIMSELEDIIKEINQGKSKQELMSKIEEKIAYGDKQKAQNQSYTITPNQVVEKVFDANIEQKYNAQSVVYKKVKERENSQELG